MDLKEIIDNIKRYLEELFKGELIFKNFRDIKAKKFADIGSEGMFFT
jgi:hypothetical protein